MIINSLILMVFLFSFAIKGDRRLPFIIFIFPAILFQAAIPVIPDNFFHLTACFLDLSVIVIILNLVKINSIALFVGAVSTVSVFANIFGWVIYEKGLSASYYDGIFIAIYSFVLMALLVEWWTCDRTHNNNSRFRSSWN